MTAVAIPSRAHTTKWVICALLFFATTINYVDRQILGLLKPTLAQEFGWNDSDYADILIAFQAAYAIGLLGFGRIIDHVGSRRGLPMSVGLWSLAAAFHAATFAKIHFLAARFALGLGESGCFPAAIKVVAERFPPHQKATATGILNAGTSVGAVLTPLVVPAIALTYGWRAAFLVTGLAGAIWIVAWLIVVRIDPPGTHDPSATVRRTRWTQLLRRRETWGFMAAKFFSDPVWSLYLNWLPDFFAKAYGLDLRTFGPPMLAVYLMADAGSVGGGWFSSHLIARGWGVQGARRRAMVFCAVCVLPLVATSGMHNLPVAVMAIGIAAAAHQAWSTNLFTLVADVFPDRAAASVVGLCAFTGTCGSILMSRVAGWTLDATGSYVPLFLYAGFAYPIALGGLALARLDRRAKTEQYP